MPNLKIDGSTEEEPGGKQKERDEGQRPQGAQTKEVVIRAWAHLSP